jgi:hypothetical protein
MQTVSSLAIDLKFIVKLDVQANIEHLSSHNIYEMLTTTLGDLILLCRPSPYRLRPSPSN